MQAHYGVFGPNASSGTLGFPGSNIVYGNSTIAGKSNGSYGPLGLNMFTNPGQVWGEFRPCVLGFDTSCGGYINARGLPYWNVDAQIAKDLGIYKERVGAQVFFTFTNIFNHFNPSNGSFSLNSTTTFGQITGQSNTPRNLEFGLRIHF